MKHKSSRQARTTRVRASIKTSGRPRLSVYRTNQHLWVQLIDDLKGVTLASANTKSLPGTKTESKLAQATKIGTSIAKSALDQKITQIVFDRGAYKYHGRVKAVAEAARTAGLKF